MREQHFDLLPLPGRDAIFVGRGDIARHLPGALMDGAQDFPGGILRAASRFERTDIAIRLSGPVAHQALVVDTRLAKGRSERMSRPSGAIYRKPGCVGSIPRS